MCAQTKFLFQKSRDIVNNTDQKVDDDRKKYRDAEASHAIVETRIFFNEKHRGKEW